MVITEIAKQKRNENRVSVYLDGAFALGMDALDAHNLGLRVGDTITPAQLAHIRDTAEFSAAQQTALRLVSRRAYTAKGIADKLAEKEYSPETIAKVLAFLTEYRYVDDYDYARRFVEECVSLKGYGFYKIKQELNRRGVPQEVIADVLSEMDTQSAERETILPLAARKLGGDFDRKNIDRCSRFLAGKGYGYDTIRWAIDRLRQEQGQDREEWT